MTDHGAQTSQVTGRKVLIDTELCAGHGRCCGLHPELFDSDDRGYPVILNETVPPGLEPGVLDAIANCPEQAISLQ